MSVESDTFCSDFAMLKCVSQLTNFLTKAYLHLELQYHKKVDVLKKVTFRAKYFRLGITLKQIAGSSH